MFFSFDGIDGVGKTTQLQLLSDWLVAHGHDVVCCRDPGSTALGEKLRDIVLTSDESISIHARSELMLYMTARTQLVEQIIRPALDGGKVVLADRFLLASVVYQGHAGGVDVDQIWQVGQIATDGFLPDLTFVLDMPVDKSAARLGDSLDRMEARGAAYFDRVRKGYLDEISRRIDVVYVNAEREVDAIQADIRSVILEEFPDIGNQEAKGLA